MANGTRSILTWKYQQNSLAPDAQLRRQCEVAVTNFQQASQQDRLRYFTTTTVSKKRLICSGRNTTALCNSQTQLFSVPSSQPPNPILGNLTQAFQGKSISPIVILVQNAAVDSNRGDPIEEESAPQTITGGDEVGNGTRRR
jgi:Circadian oscillating protein COP23